MTVALDRVKRGFAASVRNLLSRVDYFALYSAKVVSQNADGTLELTPDLEKIPQLSGVPLRLGLPGVAVKVNGGSRCLLGFENGDPSRPVATLWEISSIDTIYMGGAAITGSDVTEKMVKGSTYRSQEKSLHNDISTKLGAAGVALAAAGTALTPAGIALTTAGPLTLLPPAGVQISLAGAAITATVALLATAAAQISAASASLSAWETSASAAQDYLSQIVKLK